LAGAATGSAKEPAISPYAKKDAPPGA